MASAPTPAHAWRTYLAAYHSHPVSRAVWERCYGLRRPRVRRLAYCQLLPDDKAPHGAGTGFPMAKQRRPRVCREHHRLDRKCMALAAPGSDRCARHHLVAFTDRRALNRRRQWCGCGAQPDPGYRTCARCAGFGCGGRSDASAIPSCAWITVRLGSPLATGTTATRLGRLGRLGKLGSATARGRGGRDGSYSRSRISALPSRPGAPLSSTTLTSEPRTMRERRHSPAKPSTIAWRASS